MNSFTLPSGAKYPQLGLGTWQGEPDEVKIAVKDALKMGYRHIDSAWAYANEEAVGEAFKESFESGVLKREDLFYVTKLPQQGHRRDKVKIFLELSLKKLGLDYVDLYLIHFPVSTQFQENIHNWTKDSEGNILLDDDLDFTETWKGMEDCVEAGLAKDIGLSNFNEKQIQYIYDNAKIKPANLQVECHIYLQQHSLHELCKRLGITLTAYSPLGSPGGPEYFKKRFGLDFTLNANVLEEPLLKTLGEKYKKSPAQVALRFLVQRDIVVIPKSISAARIKQNSEIFDFALDDKDMEDIKALDKGIRIYIFDFVKGTTESKKYPF